ncbi:uncharacterized protein FOMMEDRAFT_146208 [Fomitiporia mediterranea MF3/22]|uniref:uncharacterized protein n=1 Tax=Fomitiporia mediterranea (strain MF3/22) TaxID=694068 RepID=UPI0004409352|nr:uncharacterized protein FOMMEDRAFT_146208 [Fomitiporia mediterranea MF3/22]EJD04186.1 hypothetical protein FOMMEDRAFT_146208 [Fomitiporia mediterranea MF3/22]
MSSTPDVFPGKVILVAHLHSQPGKGDDLQRYLTAIHKFANSDREPGCLTFRTARSGDTFVVFEEYTDKNAVSKHFESDQFKALAGAIPEIALGPPTLTYFEEFKSQ